MELGLQTAAVSLGQAIGSVGPGLLPKASGPLAAASLVPAVAMTAAAIASLGLTTLLASGKNVVLSTDEAT
jgi:hypothetical protein